MLSMLSGQSMAWMSPQARRPKTRWQELAESLFADLFSVRPFDSSAPEALAMLRVLAATCGDEHMRRIILFYISTLQPGYPRTEAELVALLEHENGLVAASFFN